MARINTRHDLTTPQGLFDHVAEGLMKQGKPSYELDDDLLIECRYRGPDDCKCAAGHLVPDAGYDPNGEGWAIQINDARAMLDDRITDSSIALIADMQTVHDQWASYTDLTGDAPHAYKEWVRDMRFLAQGRGLSPAILEGASA